jgi:hypothetical protein
MRVFSPTSGNTLLVNGLSELHASSPFPFMAYQYIFAGSMVSVWRHSGLGLARRMAATLSSSSATTSA